MKKQIIYIISILLAIACPLIVQAIDGSENIDKTIANLHGELQCAQQQADEELKILQDLRIQYWESIADLQREIDKAKLILYSQDGGSLFSLGLASESLENICGIFNQEKIPFQNWLQTMKTASTRHANIRKALQEMHPEVLQPQTLNYIEESIVICDSLDGRFASLRDSITLDQQRYEKLSAEISKLEKINQGVIDNIRHQIFQENNVSVISLFTTFNYSDLDIYYTGNNQTLNGDVEADTIDNEIARWDEIDSIIAIVLGIAMGIALRFILKNRPEYRSKRWYYAFLTYLVVMIVGGYLMAILLDLNSYELHVQDIYLDNYLFVFWMVLSATIRLKRPGLGWSIAAYAPLIILSFILREMGVLMIRSGVLKLTMIIVLLIMSLWALGTLIIGFKRILKADYLAVYSTTGLVFIATIMVFMGYYYPAIMLLLFCVSVMTYLSALVCLKHFFAKRIKQGGPILHLTLNYLIYPYFYIFVIVTSLDDVASVFNLNSWFDKLFVTPFVSVPQFGIISVSRILLLIAVGIFVNYIIKLVKQLLNNLDKEKYATGGHAVAITLGTMLVWFCYGIFALIVLQINHSGVIAAIGGASLGIGFAMKETFENLISGLQLMASRARPGDLVECDNARGIIKHIGILSTQIQIEDGPIVSLPNRQLLGSTFTNLSLNHRREIRHIVFDISADSDLELAKKLMLEASQGIDGVVDYDMHYVVMRNTNSGIVRLDYKCWIDSAKYLRAEPAVREAIFRAFRANGIKIADLSGELGLHINGKLAANT